MESDKFVLLGMILLVLAALSSGTASAAVVSVSNATADIQAALYSASDGDVINFSAGTYSDLKLNVNKSLTLVSDTGDYRTSGVVIAGDSWFYVNGTHVSVRGFRFENVSASDHAAVIQIARPVNTSHFVLEKNKFLNTSKRGVHQNKGGNRIESDYLIADNSFEGIGYYHHRDDANNRMTALFFYGLVNSTIRDNVIDGTTFQGMNLGRYGTFNLKILNNSISNTPRSGIQVFDAMNSSVTIEGNEIRRTNRDLTGAYLECHREEQNRAIRSEGGASEDVFNVLEVVGNYSLKTWDHDETRVCFSGGTPNVTIVRTLVHNVEAGIMIDGASGVAIRNNVITDNHDGIAICPSYCAISNHSYQFDSFSAFDEGASAVIENNVIHSNEGRDARGYGHYAPLGIRSGYNVVYGGGGIINAAGNYWGTSDDPDSTFSGGDSGTIRYAPYHAHLDFSGHENLTSGEGNVFQFNESGVVQNVSLDLSGDVPRAKLIVAELVSRPEGAGRVSSSREVYRWLEITDDVNDSLVEGGDVVFSVSRSWLNSNGVDEDDVVLLRHGGDGWDDLDTRVIDENSDEVIFSARTSGFSFFAIAGTPVSDDDDDGGRSRRSDRIEEVANSSNDGKDENASSVPEEEALTVDDGAKKNDAGGVPPAPVPDEAKGGGIWTTMIFSLAVLVLVAVAVSLWQKKARKKTKKKD